MTNEKSDETPSDELQEEIEHGRRLLKLANDRRRLLEEQSAKYGANVPIHITFELENTREEIQKLEEQLKQLEANAKTLKEQPALNQVTALEAGTIFTPEWSVLRSRVQYVDANLAYKFADASQEVNIMLGFTTLFLGAALSFIASLITAETSSELVLFGTSTGFSLLLTIIFGILARRAGGRAKIAKEQLFASGETEQVTNRAPQKSKVIEKAG